MSGDLAPGNKIPSTAQLMERYGAANSTVQRALVDLKAEGYVVGEKGRGVFVRSRTMTTIEPSAYAAPGGQGNYRYTILEVGAVRPPADAAAGLALDDGATAILRKRLTTLDGDPVELCWSYYPAAVAGGSRLEAKGAIKGGAPAVLEELGYPQRTWDERLTVRLPTTEEVEALELPADVPVVRQLRVIYSDNELPVEATVLVKGGHLYELLYRHREA